MKRIVFVCTLLLFPVSVWAKPVVSVTKPAAMKLTKPAMAKTSAMKVIPTAKRPPQPAAMAVSDATPAMGMSGMKSPGESVSLPPKTKKGSDSWWKVLLGFLSRTGLAFASALVPVLLGLGVMWLKTKLKLDSAAGLDVLLDKWADKGIVYAEQQASKLDDDPDENGAKLKLATDFVLKLVESSGFPKKAADLVEDRIEARLKAAKG